MENITIRKVEQNEIAVVRELFEKVFKETFSSQVPAFEETTRGEQIYVAVMDHKIAGMASVWEPDNFIHYLFVDSSYRNRGVGKVMVTKLAELSGSLLTLKCLIENEKGMAFYYVTGWKEIEKGMCEDGEYALLSYLV